MSTKYYHQFRNGSNLSFRDTPPFSSFTFTQADLEKWFWLLSQNVEVFVLFFSFQGTCVVCFGFFSCCLNNSLSFCEIHYTWPKTYSYYRYKTKLILLNPLRHMVKNSIDSMINVSCIWHSFNITLFIIFP